MVIMTSDFYDLSPKDLDPVFRSTLSKKTKIVYTYYLYIYVFLCTLINVRR